MVGCRRKRMIDEHARIEALSQHPKRNHHAHKRRQQQDVLDRRLARISRYKLLMPSAMAFQSS